MLRNRLQLEILVMHKNKRCVECSGTRAVRDLNVWPVPHYFTAQRYLQRDVRKPLQIWVDDKFMSCRPLPTCGCTNPVLSSYKMGHVAPTLIGNCADVKKTTKTEFRIFEIIIVPTIPA